MGCIWFDVCWCYVVVWLWWCGIWMQALFSAQHVSDVNTSILRSLRLIRRVTSWVVSGSICIGVVSGCRLKPEPDTTPPQPNHYVTPTHIEPDTTHEVTQRISRKLLRMDVLTSETC